ncbi:peptide ABC transporter substrate-binding protein [Vulcanibacillus modesticaldus]|uniref:Peptide ABC transporter substrate-binding protein n=1 Tax=Vulcanibacillus modesticaldus TaxID=337097 RepID=A0A1D2YUS2_9BACI|nr:ABC transporter substrate-binding protein [Vulcanibacillus modesticaldus]OEF99386.1 peptide ABC transporter substrate-binding protein [Vulcanibacillus modesticaldus]
MKKYLPLIFVVVLVAALTGCGVSQETSDGADDSVLVFGRGSDSVSLDPANVTDGESIKVTKNIFDTLLDYAEGSTEVVPALAESWESSDDGLVWTFYLRKGVKFHDGTDFNADAVVFNFNRWMDKDNPYHQGNFPYYGYMFGGYKGDEGHVIKEVVAKDDYTVEIRLNFPQGPFLSNIAMAPFAIVSPKAIKEYGEKIGEHPVGTGPFVFEEWVRNDKIVLKKNENYWLEGYPKLDKLIFKSIPDNSARFMALQSGDVDLIDGVNPDDVTLAEKNPALKVWLRPSMNVGYLAFNTEKPPFDNVKVRQALSMAVNKQAIIDAFYNGLAEPAKNPIPPSIWSYNDDIQDYEYNLDKARELLAEAGYPNGFTTDFWYMPVPRPYIPQGKKIAEAMQADFEKIGVKTNLVTEEWATYLEKTGNGEHSMAFLGWTGDNGDPDNFLYVLLDKDNAVAPDAGNIAFYKNDELHDILIKAQQSGDIKERTKLYRKAQEIIHEDAPWIPLVHSTPPLIGKKNIVGFVPHPTGSDKFVKVEFGK